MNQRIQELWDQAADSAAAYPSGANNSWATQVNFMERFAQLIQQAIYDEIKQELIPEEHIDAEAKIEDRFYLRGCNGGIVDALTIVKNFGVEE